MPELPEVETIRKGLQKYLVGHRIENVEIRLPKMFIGAVENCVGATIVAARRFGKGLVIDLSNGYSIAVHVKMTGQLVFSNQSLVVGRHTHVIFKLSYPNPVIPSEAIAKSRNLSTKHKMKKIPPLSKVGRDDSHVAYLSYNDMRQFGWIKVIKTAEVSQLPFFKALGLEPLKDLTKEKFTEIVHKSKAPIKTLLMDQTKIAGIGNIYANDALYRAKIHPTRPAMSLSEKEITLLFESIEFVLKKGIEVGGASEWHYVDVLGGKGKYQNFFLVYRKTGQSCKRCGTPIASMRLGGRGTFYCPKCQK